MPVKNLLLTYLYKNIHSDAQYPIFERIVDLCVKSFIKNLEGEFDTIILKYEGDYDGAMKFVFDQTDRLYHKEPCNILLLDGDILCTKSLSMFGRFPEYRIFGTQTGEVPGGLDPLGIEYQLNSGVRYFPVGLPEKLFDLGRRLADNWVSIWAYDQYIYDAMFYNQGISNYRDFIDPRLCYMVYEGERGNLGYSMNDASILHFHSSRGPEAALFSMESIARGIGL